MAVQLRRRLLVLLLVITAEVVHPTSVDGR